MAVRATFTEFDPYKLNGVTVTDRVLGHGSYATVLEVEYMGLKCAGKKIHKLLLEQRNVSYTVRRFEEECRLLSQVHHPNVVQFLGVYFQQGVPAPILVMEFLPTNLTSCIEQYGILPKEIGYSILHDVSLGLCYLHSQTPPIIHRDLSANNVLLATNMAAKISDLGVARILNLTPLQVSHMTETPGTPAYMPPEVMIANPKYNTCVDEFSYGILMIHMFSGRWPEPQVGPNRIEGDRLVPVTEAERREVFLRAIGNDHPLMDFILRCINNDPRHRANSGEIVERLTAMVLEFPASFTNRLDMLRQIEHLEAETSRKDATVKRKESELEAKTRTLEEKNTIISGMREQLTRSREHLSSKQLVVRASITWKQCANVPTELRLGKTTVINGKVYCGGGVTFNDDDDYIVCCYDTSQDNWTTLPPLPVCFFGLGQVNGKLVAVGGAKRSDGIQTNEVFTYDERSRKWKQTLPPMPTARYSSGVLSLQSALVVAGGITSESTVGEYQDAVEIFKADTSQWYKTDRLPTACYNISPVTISNTCYAVGGYKSPSGLNQALYASIDALFHNAVPANQTTHSGSSADTQSAWKTLANTPTYQPIAAVLAGNLLTIGGKETAEEGAHRKEVYMFSSPYNSWIYVSDLPEPRYVPAVAVLSSTEILVIGGWGSGKVNITYKGTLAAS